MSGGGVGAAEPSPAQLSAAAAAGALTFTADVPLRKGGAASTI